MIFRSVAHPLRPWRRHLGALALAALVSASAPAAQRAPEAPDPMAAFAQAGTQLESARDPVWALAEHRRLDRALADIKPQRPGTVDAYVIVAGLDGDPVFGREARQAAAVLARRYDAAGRTILLAGTDGSGESAAPRGSPDNLYAALARVAELMDPREDVLVLYTTSHGAPYGIVYKDGDSGVAAISPGRLYAALSRLGIENRLLLVSACYAGVFVPMLQSPSTAIVTAASAERTSFGCQADSDWTFFGDALVNHGFRKPQPLAAAAREAFGLIGQWEAKGKLEPSQPQVSIGADVPRWLAPLEARTPQAATAAVGRPAVSLLDE